MKEFIHLEDGVTTLHKCPKCASEICFLPLIRSERKKWGTLTIYKWDCIGCNIEFFQTSRTFNMKSIEGSSAFLESEGFDVDEIEKDGLKIMNELLKSLDNFPNQ